MLQVIAELRSRRTTSASTSCASSTRWAGRSSSCRRLTQFQPADTPERLEAFLARLHAYPAFMAANAEILREGLGVRADRAADRRRADDRPDRADARDPDRVGDRARRWSRSPPTPTASASATSSATSSTRPTRPSSRRSRATTSAATREEPGLWSAPDGDAALPDRDPQLDDARPRPRGGPPDRPRGARGRSSSSAARSPARPGSATTRRPTARRSTPTPANTPGTKDELVARAHEDIERAMAVAPRYFGVAAAGRLRRPRGRGVQGEGRAVRLLLPAVARRLAARDLLRQRLRPAEPQVHEAGDDDLPRGGSRPPLPDRARDGEPDT